MGTEVLKIYIILGIILVILMGAGFYYVFNESVPDLPQPSVNIFPEPSYVDPSLNGQNPVKLQGVLEDIEDLARAKVRIVKSGKNKITVYWENLPEGTNRIVIFRSKAGGAWTRWNTISIGSSAGGSAEILLKKGEDASAYSYYAQAFTPNGYTLWASPPTEAENPASSSTSATSTATTATRTAPIAQGNSPTIGSGSQGNSPVPSSTGTSTTASLPPPLQSGNQTTTTPVSPQTPPSASSGPPIAYYTPDGQIAGYFSPQLDPFWVTHVNQKIEIGWQNLPPPTDVIIVYRSSSSTGPWKELLRQNHPNTIGPDFVRLVDYTLSESHYYRMDALLVTTVIAAYEPIILPGISQ